MKRFLIALNLVIWSVVAVEASANQIDNKPHSSKLYLFSTKNMGNNTIRATYGVEWKDGTMTYTNIELVCGELKARDIGYSDDGTGTVWKDRSKELYNGKTHYELVGKGNEGSLQYNVYRAVCKNIQARPSSSVVTVEKKDVIVKGIYIGMTQSEYRSIISAEAEKEKQDCLNRLKSSNSYLPESYCDSPSYSNKITIGNVPVRLSPTFDDQNKLREVWGSMAHGSYGFVKAALISKFNMNCLSGVKRNAFNASFNSETCVYKSNTVRLKIEDRWSKIDDAYFEIKDTSYVDSREKKEVEKILKDV